MVKRRIPTPMIMSKRRGFRRSKLEILRMGRS
jgi:hypothetical protein